MSKQVNSERTEEFLRYLEQRGLEISSFLTNSLKNNNFSPSLFSAASGNKVDYTTELLPEVQAMLAELSGMSQKTPAEKHSLFGQASHIAQPQTPQNSPALAALNL